MNSNITTTIIISVYKNIDALKVILNSLLHHQTHPATEIIISEDGEYDKMQEFIASLDIKNLRHIRQKDEGWRKNKALNNAIKAATSEYLIFIDGDVVPHPRFIEGHLAYAKPRKVCAGKRVELGPKFSKMLINGKITIEELTKKFLIKAYALHQDGVRHYEDGIYLQPNSWIYKKFIQTRTISYLIGCNFSCYKKDIESINGFDEQYIHPAVGEDVDINWRFRASGIEVSSCRNIANVYHLYHKKGFSTTELTLNDKILEKTIQQNQYICKDGLKKLENGEKI